MVDGVAAGKTLRASALSASLPTARARFCRPAWPLPSSPMRIRDGMQTLPGFQV